MRYDAEHKERTRERLLQEAAKAIRADGPYRIGVAGVMAKAGLTHGGFYAHFASKEDLLAAGVEQMFKESRARLAEEAIGRTPAHVLSRYISFYLSTAHRDTRSAGCPLPFLSADAPRLAQPVRERFAQGVAALTAALTKLLGDLGHEQPEDLASSVLSELVGALSLARAEPDASRSDAILTRSKTALKRRLGLETQP